MKQFPDFSGHGYQVEKELSQNRTGGRVTYLARNRQNQPVVIKQFQFAKTESNWSEYDAYIREIRTLRDLNHPNIPRYLDSFETDNGFCMVQEYKPAISLAVPRSFAPTEIRKIAADLLGILAYLQHRIPPVIHRDIKPENILVDESMNVYLVDFGFARVGDGKVAVSSVVKGTLGFMPPEQLLNRQLTEASDLYSLGITLICLLTHTRSEDVGTLIDVTYRINFKPLVPKLSVPWVNWLEKMVEPRPRDRFANAAEALAALPQALILPEVIFSETKLNLVSTRPGGDRLTHSLSLRNPIPQTLLEGRWEVAPHPHDPPHTPDHHVWISVSPAQFRGNETTCQITVDTSKLMDNKRYQRLLLLHTNALPKTYTLDLQVQTARSASHQSTPPLALLGLLSTVALCLTWLLGWVVPLLQVTLNAPPAAPFLTAIGAGIGLEVAAWMLGAAGSTAGAAAGVLAGLVIGGCTLVMLPLVAGMAMGLGAIATLATGIGFGTLGGLALGLVVEAMVEQRFRRSYSFWIALLTLAVGSAVGLGLRVGFVQPLVMTTLMSTTLPLGGLLLHLPLKQAQLMSNYRRSDQFLIKP